MKKTRTFPKDAQSIAAARRFATEALSTASHELIEAVELMVSELATNAILHAETAFDLLIVNSAGRIRIEVTDRAGGTPTMQSPAPHEPRGRGLLIVEMLSEAWGIEQTTALGKTVWFTLTATAESKSAAQASSRDPRARDPERAAEPPAAGPAHSASECTARRRRRTGDCGRHLSFGMR